MKLEELIAERKWFDFTESIKKSIMAGTDNKHGEYMADLFVQNIKRIHPISITSTTTALTNSILPKKAIELVELAIKTISVSSIEEETYAQEIISLRLCKCAAAIKMRIFEDIETEFISLNNSKISNENLSILFLVAASYYEEVGNIENAQEYLLKHARLTDSVFDCEKLVRLSILSRSFYDFAAISSYKEFEKISNELKSLFLQFQTANISDIVAKHACKILGINNFEYLREKLYLVKILKVCFDCKEKFVFFDHLIEQLQLNEVSTVKMLLKALGLGVVDGWIDSEQRIFYFNSALPRALSIPEIVKMKYSFFEWKMRIEKILETME